LKTLETDDRNQESGRTFGALRCGVGAYAPRGDE